MPDEEFLHGLELEVEAEVELVDASLPADETVPPSQWQFDPEDVEREEAGLSSLLGAVKALEKPDETG